MSERKKRLPPPVSVCVKVSVQMFGDVFISVRKAKEHCERENKLLTNKMVNGILFRESLGGLGNCQLLYLISMIRYFFASQQRQMHLKDFLNSTDTVLFPSYVQLQSRQS